MPKRLSIQEYVNGILSGDRIVLGRAITLIESNLEADKLIAADVLQEILPKSGDSIRIGITGVPGVGKSTFIEALGKQLTSKGKSVAVLAVDPSSQKTGGSILGDKTRMDTLASDPNAFIRPSPAGDALGGVANKTRETMLLCEAAGFDVILIETVGVGQSEVSIKNMTDFFLLLMLSGAGDELQGIKKGIMEMADLIAITKADGDNVSKADLAKNEFENALHLFPANENGWSPKVICCSALNNERITDIWAISEAYIQVIKENGFFNKNRTAQNKYWFHEMLLLEIKNHFYNNTKAKKEIELLEASIEKGQLPVLSGVQALIKKYL